MRKQYSQKNCGKIPGILALLLIVLASCVSLQNAAAQSATWDGDTNGVWATTTNWVGNPAGVPGAGNIATFNGAGKGNTTINLGTAKSVDQIIFDTASVAGYTIGVAGDTLTLTDNGETANVSLTNTVAVDQIIAANILLGPDATTNDTSFVVASTAGRLIITGDIDTAVGGAAGIKRLEFGDIGAAPVGTIQVDGSISNTGAATRLELFVAGANVELNGIVDTAAGGNTMRTIIRDGSIATVGATGAFGRGTMAVRNGTLNINTDLQQFDSVLNLGDPGNQAGNATVNIGAANTLLLNTGITYRAWTGSTDASVASIAGGTIQITGADRVFTVHNNSNVAPTSPELIITSTITAGGTTGANGDNNLFIRGAIGEAEGGTILLAPTGTANSFGGVTVQAGTLQLGAGGLSSEGDFLAFSANNSAAFPAAAATVATVDLLGTTHALGNGTGTAGVGGNLTLGGTNTTNIADNGFQANVVDTVGGGKLTNVNSVTYNKGTGTGIQRNGAATISAAIDFDTTGTNKVINLADGRAAADLTISSALNTTVAGHDFTVIGEGTLLFSGSLGELGTVGAHDLTVFNNQKTIIGAGAGANIGGVRAVTIAQRNNNSLSNFGVELDINGQDFVLQDALQIGGNTNNYSGGGVLSKINLTDSVGGGRVVMTGSVDGNRTIGYGAGTGSANLMATISADVKFDGGAGVFNIGNGADAVDLLVSGTITDDGGGNRNIVKNGTGTLRLSATDNLYNILVINSGRVQINGTGSLGDNVVQLGSVTTDGILENYGAGGTFGARVRIGNSTAVNTGEGSILNNGNGALTFTSGTFNQAQNADNDRTLTLGGNYIGDDNIISGKIVDNIGAGGSVSINKTGESTWVLSNADNSYSGGTTVSAGTLKGTSLGTGSLTIGSGATIAPGNSIGTMSAGDTTWNGGSFFDFEFSNDGSSGVAGTDWDLLDITGTLDFVGVPVALNLFSMSDVDTPGLLSSWDPLKDSVWLGFITTTGGINGFSANTFAINATGFQNTVNSSSMWSVVQNGNNLDLHYTAVPEPGTLGMLFLAFASLTFFRRRRSLSST